MTVVGLDRRFANFRAGLAARPAPPASEVRRASSIGAERLAAAVDGELVRTSRGSFVRVEAPSTLLPVDRERLATLPGQPPADAPLLCLDTETTGLATAAGTLAFLVGLGWWEGSRFRQVQLLLPDHADEPALLAELAARIPVDGWLVTYNGRGFDWPLLVARYRMAGANPPVHSGHLDLLPLVRRVFRHRMPDARLASVESRAPGAPPWGGCRRLGDPWPLPRLSPVGRAWTARRRRPPQRRGRALAGEAPRPRRSGLRGRRTMARGATGRPRRSRAGFRGRGPP